MDANATISRPCNQCGCRGLGRSISHEGFANQKETSHCTDNFLNNSNDGCDGQSLADIGSNNLKQAFKRRATARSEGKNNAHVDSKRTKRNPRKNSKDDLKNITNSKQIMYYCEYCDTCSTHKSAQINDKLSHYTGKCMSFPAKFCSDCGLKFTNHMLKNHGTHGKQNNLDDFKFFRWQDEKPLSNPPIPRYPYCAKCKVYFIPSAQDVHNCSIMGVNNGKICDTCDKTYDEEAYKVHLMFHNATATISTKDEVKIKDNSADVQEFDKINKNKVKDTKCDVKMKTIVKFLRCKSCTAAYHIKAYADRHKCGTSLRYCTMCQLYIPEIHYKKHVELHDKVQNMELRKEITEF